MQDLRNKSLQNMAIDYHLNDYVEEEESDSYLSSLVEEKEEKKTSWSLINNTYFDNKILTDK